MKKKFTALLLAFILVLSCMPSYAVTEQADSGICGADGDNLTWEVDADERVLRISGTGDMADYNGLNPAPWYERNDDIYIIEIEYGVTGIGTFAFSALTNVFRISCPATVTQIRNYAFHMCEELTDIALPSGLTLLGQGAFNDCISLKRIAIPEGITVVSRFLFASCSSLENVVLHGNIETIDEGAFNDCYALKKIDIPEGVKTINTIAFYRCSGLQTVVLPSTLEQIKGSAFLDCKSLTQVMYAGDESDWNSINIMNSNEDLTEAEISFDYSPVSNTVQGFCGAEGDNLIWELNLDTGKLVISGKGAMADYGIYDAPWTPYRTEITSVKVEEGVTRIGDTAFALIYGLAEVILPESLEEIGGDVFTKAAIKEITIPENVTSIGSGAFYSCYFLGAVELPDKITVIEEYTFFQCYELVSIKLPAALKEIKSEAFSECGELRTVEIPDKTEKIGSFAFCLCAKLTTVTLPMSLQTIENSAFRDCFRLNEVYYSGSETQWENNVTVGENNEKLKSASLICLNEAMVGDATGDGRITINDVLAVRKYLAGIETPEGLVIAACDVSGDGRISIADILKIRKYIAGIIDSFPAEV